MDRRKLLMLIAEYGFGKHFAFIFELRIVEYYVLLLYDKASMIKFFFFRSQFTSKYALNILKSKVNTIPLKLDRPMLFVV